MLCASSVSSRGGPLQRPKSRPRNGDLRRLHGAGSGWRCLGAVDRPCGLRAGGAGRPRAQAGAGGRRSAQAVPLARCWADANRAVEEQRTMGVGGGQRVAWAGRARLLRPRWLRGIGRGTGTPVAAIAPHLVERAAAMPSSLPGAPHGGVRPCDGGAMLAASRRIHIAAWSARPPASAPATRFRDVQMLPWPRLRNTQPALDQLHHAAWAESLILGEWQRHFSCGLVV